MHYCFGFSNPLTVEVLNGLGEVFGCLQMCSPQDLYQ